MLEVLGGCVARPQEAKEETNHPPLFVECAQHQSAVLLGSEEKVQGDDVGIAQAPDPPLQLLALVELLDGGQFLDRDILLVHRGNLLRLATGGVNFLGRLLISASPSWVSVNVF